MLKYKKKNLHLENSVRRNQIDNAFITGAGEDLCTE